MAGGRSVYTSSYQEYYLALTIRCREERVLKSINLKLIQRVSLQKADRQDFNSMTGPACVETL